MIVGPTGGGKTVVINTLVGAQVSLGLPTTLYTLNPKVFKNLLYQYTLKQNKITGLFCS